MTDQEAQQVYQIVHNSHSVEEAHQLAARYTKKPCKESRNYLILEKYQRLFVSDHKPNLARTN